jgi:hypothetical protein
MSNLSKRIEKANKLTFVNTPGVTTTTGSTWGSNDDRYTVSLFQKVDFEQLEIENCTLDVAVISTLCERLNIQSGNLNPMEPCKGNCHHTVCYHSLGYLKFKLAGRNKTISYYQNILGALNGLNFGGQLTKVTSKQGEGYVWAVVRDKKPDIIDENELSAEDFNGAQEQSIKEQGILPPVANIDLMRGPEGDEGID